MRKMAASAISRRGIKYKDSISSLCKAESVWSKNPCKELSNPAGIINLGTSQNRLMFDLLYEKFSDPSNRQVHEEYTLYGDDTGYKSFKEATAKFLNHVMKPTKSILPGNLIALNGCGPAVEALGSVLADPGEGFLIPAPYYGGFIKDLTARVDVKIVSADIPSQCDGKSGLQYKLTVDILEKSYNDATQQGIKVRALLLVNPNNPFGCIYTEDEMQGFLQFAHRNDIHVIVDELYLLSVFKEGCTMKSVLSFENIPDPKRLHVLWGLSKDFCVSGFRCGVLHTTNQDVLDSIAQIAEFQQVCPLVQHMFTNILSDLDWIDNIYTPTSHQRLRESYKTVCETLQKCGIPYVEAVAGFFIWVDFRQLLNKPTYEEEWKVFNTFVDNKLYIMPGIAFASSEPGWFRIVFSLKSSSLSLAMDRFEKAIEACRKELDN